MLESVLERKNASFKIKITVKTVVSAAIIALAVILPQLIHIAFGASGGARWLPMYLPVLLGGCLLGWQWGLGVGLLSPIVSYLITLATGSPMPVATRLPYMAVELGVFAAVSGLFSKKIAEKSWLAFPAVSFAAVAGRTVFLLLAAIFQTVSPLSASVAWSQIQAGLWGLALQAVVVPAIVMLLTFVLNEKKPRDK